MWLRIHAYYLRLLYHLVALCNLFQGQTLLVIRLATQQVLVKLTGLLDDSQGKLLVHCLVVKAKFVLGLAVRCFVVPEPYSNFVYLSGKLPAACDY